VLLLVINSDWTGLWRQGAFSNLIRDVRAYDGDGDNRVDIFLSCGEMEFNSGGGDNLGDDKRASPLVVQFLHGVIRRIVLET